MNVCRHIFHSSLWKKQRQRNRYFILVGAFVVTEEMPVLITCHTNYLGGTRWRSWLRHCVTSRKVAGSIPDGVNGIFH